MKKSIYSLLSVVALALYPVASHSGIYVKAEGGLNYPTQSRGSFKFKPQEIWGGAIGYNFNDVIRIDINHQQRRLKTTDPLALITIRELTNQTTFFNFYLNLTDYGTITPYITTGIGINKNQTKGYETSTLIVMGNKISNKTVWNLGAGAAMDVVKHVKIDFMYKYLNLGNFQYTLLYKSAPNEPTIFTLPKKYAHEGTVGLVIEF